ncbi:type I-E CRISPR-associated protein Cas7/Cse4/CasC [Actinosynnema sp. CS-041913]|uniref:type I-E CRISPR-associated protein Cas7/Cse4/CasC n=1 Tax=Actinosynnema sp. CS-041913 TaxID=3239917 RepID=UPI003D8EE444
MPACRYLDIHVLQTVPPSNINRDDAGSPKKALNGGARRAGSPRRRGNSPPGSPSPSGCPRRTWAPAPSRSRTCFLWWAGGVGRVWPGGSVVPGLHGIGSSGPTTTPGEPAGRPRRRRCAYSHAACATPYSPTAGRRGAQQAVPAPSRGPFDGRAIGQGGDDVGFRPARPS